MHRAFTTWSDAHPYIAFEEVTSLCELSGELSGEPNGCSHAEVWVSYNRAAAGATADTNTITAARAMPDKYLTSTDFVSVRAASH